MAARRGSSDERGRTRAQDRETRWAPVATAHDQLTAEIWQQLMLQESIPAMLDPHDAISFMGLSSTPVRLIVPVEYVAKAREVLAEIQGELDSRELDDSGEVDGAPPV